MYTFEGETFVGCELATIYSKVDAFMEYFKRNHKIFCQNGQLHSLNFTQIPLNSKWWYQPLYRVTFLTIGERRMDSYDGPSSD